MAEIEKVENAQDTSTDKKKKKSAKQEALEWGITLAVAIVIAIVVRLFIAEPVSVDGNSMYPTLKHGEIMIVNKWSYRFSGDPERFDVVICHFPNRGNTNFVKRIIGLPGDTVEVKDGYLIVNGVIYAEKFLHERPVENFGPYTVPEGQYFVMGDNRNNSNDSRRGEVGPLDREFIIGKVSAVLWHTIPSTLEDSGLNIRN